MHSITDEELLHLLKTDSETAFTILFDRYRERLFLEADSRLGDEDAANDVVQEVFIWLWQKRSSIEVQTSLKHYLLQAVRYKCIDNIRQRANTQKRQQQYAYFRETIVNSTNIENIELAGQLNNAINDIAPSSRTAFKMMYIERKTLREIALEMGISVFTVKNHIGNALKKLRKALEKVK